MRQLAITADDYGASVRVNAAILRAARAGVLTGTSWMAGGVAASEALAAATEVPALALGVHLTCVLGRAVLPTRFVRDLVDGNGCFTASPTRQGLRLAFSARMRAQLRDELRAQIERCLAAGRQPRHLDGHLDFHVHPGVFPIVAELAREYGVSAVRVPRDPLAPALRWDRRHAPRKVIEATIFALLCRRAASIAIASGLQIADRVYGHHQTGAVDEAYVLHVVRRLPAGMSELYCHPGAAVGHDDELGALTSPRVAAAIAAAAITCRHYDRQDRRR